MYVYIVILHYMYTCTLLFYTTHVPVHNCYFTLYAYIVILHYTCAFLFYISRAHCYLCIHMYSIDKQVFLHSEIKLFGSIHRGGYHIQYPVSNLTKVHIQRDMVLVTFGYSTHLA